MSFVELLMIAIALSMDAFAVAICKGLEMPKIKYQRAILIALFFGVFQGLMPVIGYLVGFQFKSFIESFDHWIAFALLAIIGGKMLYEGIKEGKEEIACETKPFKIGNLFVLAIATSIDALAVGVSFAFLEVKIVLSASIIAITTFAISFIGVVIGNKFGCKYRSKAEIAGGIILILIGIKIVLSHLGILPF